MASPRSSSDPSASGRARPRTPRWGGGLAPVLGAVPRQHMEDGMRDEVTEASRAAPAPDLAYALAATVLRPRPRALVEHRGRRGHEAAALGLVATLTALITAALIAAAGVS